MKEESGLFNFGVEGVRMEGAFPCNNKRVHRGKNKTIFMVWSCLVCSVE